MKKLFLFLIINYSLFRINYSFAQPNNKHYQIPINKIAFSLSNQEVYNQQNVFIDKLVAPKWILDTFITYNLENAIRERIVLTYDLDGIPLGYTVEKWKNNTWNNNWKNTYIYDSKGYLVSWLCEIWLSSWVNNYREKYTYDENSNKLSKLSEIYKYSSWTNDKRYTYSYDVNGNLLTELFEKYEYNAWHNDSKDSYIYDLKGNVISWLNEYWGSQQNWTPYTKHTYTYNENGNMLTDLLEFWTVYNKWIADINHTFTYYDNNKLFVDLREYWLDSSWVNSDKHVYTYDSIGNKLTDFEYWYDNDWYTVESHTYIYDDTGNIQIILFDNGSNVLKTTYSYDINGNSITGKNEQSNYSNWSFCTGTLSMFSEKNLRFSIGDIFRYEAHWTSFPLGINQFSNINPQVSIYPNPSTNNITIDISGKGIKYSQITITNITGQEIYKTTTNKQKTTINTSNFPAGIYFVRFTTPTFSSSQKFIIIK